MENKDLNKEIHIEGLDIYKVDSNTMLNTSVWHYCFNESKK